MNPTKKKKLVFISQDFYPDIGGITTWCHQFAYHFSLLGWNVDMICKSANGKENIKSNYNIKGIEYKNWKRDKYKLIRKVISKYNFKNTIFICSNWKMAIPCYQLSYFNQINYYVAIHGLDAIEGRKLNNLLKRRVLINSTGVVFASSYTRSLIKKEKFINKLSHRLIHNAVDINIFKKLDNIDRIKNKYQLKECIRLFSIGRIIDRKGLDYTIEAISELKEYDIHYYIGGKGDYQKYLKKLVKKLNLEDKVSFLGFIPDQDLIELYNASDIFMMPSRNVGGWNVEGFGITYLEAAACGSTSVGGRNSGAEDAIIDNITGLLADPNSVEDIRTKIKILIENKELRKKLAENAYNRVLKEMKWTDATAKFDKFINKKIYK